MIVLVIIGIAAAGITMGMRSSADEMALCETERVARHADSRVTVARTRRRSRLQLNEQGLHRRKPQRWHC